MRLFSSNLRVKEAEEYYMLVLTILCVMYDVINYFV